MITPALPSSLPNAISPFSPVGKLAVGEESTESRNTPFSPVEELAETSRQDNRASASERAAQAEEEAAVGDRPDNGGQRNRDRDDAQEDAQQQQLAEDQRVIQELSARDREVRAHEQAHAAVGGQLAGAPTYQYTRGPDGVRYAVAGEVSISTGAVPGDPEATLRNARIVQRAALAPAEPSPQDRRVAAEAAQLEQQALQQIAVQAQEERQQVEEQAEQRRLEREQEQEALSESADSEDGEREDEAFFQNNIDINQRLIDIGATESPAPVGGLLDLIA